MKHYINVSFQRVKKNSVINQRRAKGEVEWDGSYDRGDLGGGAKIYNINVILGILLERF